MLLACISAGSLDILVKAPKPSTCTCRKSLLLHPGLNVARGCSLQQICLCRHTAVGEAARHVPLARGHVVNGAVHEEGCATASHILQRRYFPLPFSTHPITTSCFQQHCIICCLLHIPEMHMMYKLSSNGTMQVMQTEFESSRACLHCMHDLLIASCRACSGAFLCW